MSVLIKGFPLPNNCGACPLRLAWCRERIYMVNRPEHCPLVPVPPHGRARDMLGRPHYDRPQTNADRIRFMTDEELAEEMSNRLSEDCLMCPVLEANCPAWESKEIECKDAMLEWLKKAVEK